MTTTDTHQAQGLLIDGKALAASMRQRLAQRIADIRDRGHDVSLDAVLVGTEDNAARVYANNQAKTCESLGIAYRLHELPGSASYDDIAGRVLLLNTEDRVTGIMVHLPLPEGVDPYRVQKLIAPEKDVEGVNPANIGNVVYGRASLVPCTARASVEMLRSVLHDLKGKRCVVVGAGDVVGKPIAVLLMREEATVVSCNKHTPNLAELTRNADVVIAAAGVPGLVTPDMIRQGSIVIDVGVNRVTGPDGNTRTVGDVQTDAVRAIASHVSPVPGGVGPVTVAVLLANVVDAAERAARPAETHTPR